MVGVRSASDSVDRYFLYEPEEIGYYVFFPPKGLAPLSTSNSDFASEMLVSAIAVPVSSEEEQSVMEIRKVNLDGNVVDPWCYSVRIPIRKKVG
jgi:hypothetical protein